MGMNLRGDRPIKSFYFGFADGSSFPTLLIIRSINIY